MGVIPSRAILISKEFVRETTAGSDRALADTRNTIHEWSSVLEEAVPMDTSAFLGTSDLVVNGNFYLITPVGLDGRLEMLC